MEMQEITQAVARGWCYPKNENKIMDIDLVDAIGIEIKKLFVAFKEPQLGCATTRELLTEVKVRIEIDGQLDYRTIDAN